MSGASLRVQRRSGDVLDALTKLKAASVNMFYVMDAIGAEIEEEVRLCFRDSRDPYGNSWLPLHFRDGQPLMDTRVLLNSITHRTANHSVQVGTNIEYAGTHEFGARRGAYGTTRRGAPVPWGDVPARPFLPTDDLPESWETSILGILQKHFLEVPGVSS